MFYPSILCSEEAVLQAAENGDITKLRELNEKGVEFRVTDNVSNELCTRLIKLIICCTAK